MLIHRGFRPLLAYAVFAVVAGILGVLLAGVGLVGVPYRADIVFIGPPMAPETIPAALEEVPDFTYWYRAERVGALSRYLLQSDPRVAQLRTKWLALSTEERELQARAFSRTLERIDLEIAEGPATPFEDPAAAELANRLAFLQAHEALADRALHFRRAREVHETVVDEAFEAARRDYEENRAGALLVGMLWGSGLLSLLLIASSVPVIGFAMNRRPMRLVLSRHTIAARGVQVRFEELGPQGVDALLQTLEEQGYRSDDPERLHTALQERWQAAVRRVLNPVAMRDLERLTARTG